MAIVIYILSGCLVLLGLGNLLAAWYSKRVGCLVAGICFTVAGVTAILLVAWWPLLVGFVLGWILRLMGLDPSWGRRVSHELTVEELLGVSKAELDARPLEILDITCDEFAVADLTKFVRACFGNTTAAEVIDALNRSALTPTPHPDPLGLDQRLPPFDQAHHFAFRSGKAKGILQLLVTEGCFLQVGYQLLFPRRLFSGFRKACKTAMQVAVERYGRGMDSSTLGAKLRLFADDATHCYVSFYTRGPVKSLVVRVGDREIWDKFTASRGQNT